MKFSRLLIQILTERFTFLTVFYVISKPICTPANPKKSVDLQLSNYAVIKASDNWSDSEAMIRLGGKDAANDTHTAGSNYSLTGGVI